MNEIGRFRQRYVSITEVSDHIHIQPQAVAPVILSVSPCRSSTTVLLRVFGNSGVQAHFQQLKNILRWLMLGEDFQWTVPQGPNLIFLKETLGPFSNAECRFNPLQALLGAGFPLNKLHLLIIGRDPLQTWASWHACWGQRTDIERFITAYRTTDQVRKQAQDLGIGSTHLVYEAFRDHPIGAVVHNLFKRLAIAYTPLAIGHWETLPGYGLPGSNVILPREPPPFVTCGIHDRPIQATRFAYVERRTDSSVVRERDIARVNESGLFDIYRTWFCECEENLDFRLLRDTCG